MICFFGPCHKAVLAADPGRVELHRIDGAEVAFGRDAPGGSLDQAVGPLVREAHHKCYLAHVRRERLLAARAVDPSAQDRLVADWREPETCDVEALSADAGADRGAGAAPERVRPWPGPDPRLDRTLVVRRDAH
jgi:hypothetical protein